MIGKLVVNSDQLCRRFKRMDGFCLQSRAVVGLARCKKKCRASMVREKNGEYKKKSSGTSRGVTWYLLEAPGSNRKEREISGQQRKIQSMPEYRILFS